MVINRPIKKAGWRCDRRRAEANSIEIGRGRSASLPRRLLVERRGNLGHPIRPSPLAPVFHKLHLSLWLSRSWTKAVVSPKFCVINREKFANPE